jgi:hypothetical protein
MIQPNPKGGNLMKDTFEVPSMMTKEDVTMMILSAKKQAGLTWEGIAEKIGMSPVWIQSACMGINGFQKTRPRPWSWHCHCHKKPLVF